MTEYSIYAPLIPHSNTIRLLVPHSGRWDDAITAHLQEVSLKHARDLYTTISYTWGINTVKQMLIECNGKRVPISENLFTILRRLRRPDEVVYLWADALCINQADSIERTYQVGLIGDIYANSRETVIWLGEKSAVEDVGDRFLGTCMALDDRECLRKGGPPRISWHGDAREDRLLQLYLSHVRLNESLKGSRRQSRLGVADTSSHVFGAFCLIQSFAQGTSRETMELLEENDKTAWMMGQDSNLRFGPVGAAWMHARGSRSGRILKGMERLMSRTWRAKMVNWCQWSRIWVIQETVLSRKATIQLGMLSAPWTMFASAAAYYTQDYPSFCLDLSGTFEGQGILNRFSNAVLQKIDNTRSTHQTPSPTSSTTLLSLLWKCRPLEATNKRDKVFALLRLATNWQNQPPLAPDYNLDVGATFVQTSITNIQRSQSLTVLASDLEAMLNRKRATGIPSWVIDWPLPCLPTEIERVASLNIYNASANQTSTVHLHHHHPILETEDILINTDPQHHQHNPAHANPQHLRHSPRTKPLIPHPLAPALPTPTPPQAKHCETANRRVFVMGMGYLGIGPNSTEPGGLCNHHVYRYTVTNLLIVEEDYCRQDLRVVNMRGIRCVHKPIAQPQALHNGFDHRNICQSDADVLPLKHVRRVEVVQTVFPFVACELRGEFPDRSSDIVDYSARLL
ncbi:hypothetical protein P280DRAFT_507725 [Massarina eburnea CBS 473.64]|uniref:Heterokaryon incompatibility domain-containing protein n=1 Tax=Massarina eburnea CBS 473.64 TaxID=1395130 RepID=A0A6A6S1S5_9PLEO|nr:hypothetical protein P280DRAFT_507725 [Massarina eburnea CBS 473.64]